MQLVSSRIWTRVVVSISYDDNHYTTGTSYIFIFIIAVVVVLVVVVFPLSLLLLLLLANNLNPNIVHD